MCEVCLKQCCNINEDSDMSWAASKGFQVIIISNTRVFYHYIQTLKNGLKKWGVAEFFNPTSKCLDM